MSNLKAGYSGLYLFSQVLGETEVGGLQAQGWLGQHSKTLAEKELGVVVCVFSSS